MIQNHLRYASVLRIDHVMGLHRLYVIPEGASAKHGVYLRYQAEELYAILSIESHRSGTLLVGEDLGTVPPEVHAAMAEHGVHGMHVVEYAARAEGRALEPAPHTSVASVNTHDMPTFRAYWEGLDIDDRVDLGWIDARQADVDRRGRAQLRNNLRAHWSERTPLAPDADAAEAYVGCATELGESDARLVLLALEDMWGETAPHNVPGTYHARDTASTSSRRPLAPSRSSIDSRRRAAVPDASARYGTTRACCRPRTCTGGTKARTSTSATSSAPT
jgi:4-alpha-glucanotransferase